MTYGCKLASHDNCSREVGVLLMRKYKIEFTDKARDHGKEEGREQHSDYKRDERVE